MTNKELIDNLERNHSLTKEEYAELISKHTQDDTKYLFEKAVKARKEHYGTDIYIRGLVEISNYCKNDCYYCGIRKSNKKADRYRLTKEEILDCCNKGYELGFRTFVLQGGEDGHFTDDYICEIISAIKTEHPDCAVTLSLGEKSRESYQRYFDCGADRYLLRHETANDEHYRKLHPQNMSPQNRKRCLWDLKEIGYQVGCGFMVGSPYQTAENLAEDLKFIEELKPDMVGIGPFLPHKDTPFADEEQTDIEPTLFLIAIIRLISPTLLIPSTTALGTADPIGREKGILAGANVVMPNLSPVSVRGKYLLYDNKICTGEESAECRMCLQRRMESIGYKTVVSRGDRKTNND